MSHLDNLFEKKCRVCLQEQKILKSIAEKDKTCESLTLSEMISCCTGIEVSNAGQPSKVCKNCIKDLLTAYKFRRKCLESHEFILQLYLKDSLDDMVTNVASVPKEETILKVDNTETVAEDKEMLPIFKKEPELDLPKTELNDLKFEFCDVDSDHTDSDHEDSDHAAGPSPSPSDDDDDDNDITYEPEIIITKQNDTPDPATTTEAAPSSKKKKRKKGEKVKKEPKNTCPLCPELKAFKSTLLLKAHNLIEHEKTGQCDKCPMKFKTYPAMRNHLIKHNAFKVHICDVCGKQFNSRKALLLHMMTHTGEKPFKCEQCDYSCAQQGNLTQHMMKHSGKRPFKCRYCDKTYVFHSGRDYHEKTHSEERPFKCTYCEKAFRFRNLWREHIITHQPDLHVSCEYCGKTFGRKKNLIIHLRLHTGRTFCCELCGKTFIQNAFLTTHMKKHHPQKTPQPETQAQTMQECTNIIPA